MRQVDGQRALPASKALRDDRPERGFARIDAAADVLRLRQVLERKFLQHRITDWNVVARIKVAGELRDLDLHAEAVAAVVNARIEPADRAARAVAIVVSGTEGVGVAPRRAADMDGHDVRGRIALARYDLDAGEKLAVIERELRAQQLAGVVGLAIAIAQVAAQQWFADRVLRDGRGAEGIALAGLQFEHHVGAVRGRIDLQLVAQQSRIQVAEGRGRRLQIRLDLFIGRVLEPRSLDQCAPGRDMLEHRIIGACAADADGDVVEQYWVARTDVDLHAPVVLLVLGRQRRLDQGSVVAERTQCVAHFTIDTPEQSRHRVRLNPVAVLVAFEAEQREHIAAQIAVDAIDLNANFRRRRPRQQQHGRQRQPGAGMCGADPACGLHQTLSERIWHGSGLQVHGASAVPVVRRYQASIRRRAIV